MKEYYDRNKTFFSFFHHFVHNLPSVAEHYGLRNTTCFPLKISPLHSTCDSLLSIHSINSVPVSLLIIFLLTLDDTYVKPRAVVLERSSTHTISPVSLSVVSVSNVSVSGISWSWWCVRQRAVVLESSSTPHQTPSSVSYVSVSSIPINNILIL
jgi:hypothetical protein